MNDLKNFWLWYRIQENRLDEIQRGEKEGLPKITDNDRIKAYAKFGYLAHFGSLGEKGRFSPDRYVKSHKFEWNTPVGVYGYPIDKMADAVAARKVPFPVNAYGLTLYILKVNKPEKLLVVSKEFDTESFIANLKKFIDPAKVDKAVSQNNYDPVQLPVYITNELTRNPYEWSKLLEKMGYVGIYDPGFGIIHPNEPTQVVVFGTQHFEVVEKFLSPSDPLKQGSKYRKIIQSGKIKEIEELALKPGLPVPIYKLLADTEQPGVMINLANNRFLPESVAYKLLDYLKNVDEYSARLMARFLAQNTKFSENFLFELAMTETAYDNFDVSLTLLQNPKINKSWEVLARMSASPHISVKEQVLKMKVPSWIIDDMMIPKNNLLMINMLMSPSITEEQINKIVSIIDVGEAIYAAKKSASIPVLKALTKHPDKKVRASLFYNGVSSFSNEIMELLAKDPDQEIRTQAEKNIEANKQY